MRPFYSPTSWCSSPAWIASRLLASETLNSLARLIFTRHRRPTARNVEPCSPFSDFSGAPLSLVDMSLIIPFPWDSIPQSEWDLASPDACFLWNSTNTQTSVYQEARSNKLVFVHSKKMPVDRGELSSNPFIAVTGSSWRSTWTDALGSKPISWRATAARGDWVLWWGGKWENTDIATSHHKLYTAMAVAWAETGWTWYRCVICGHRLSLLRVTPNYNVRNQDQ